MFNGAPLHREDGSGLWTPPAGAAVLHFKRLEVINLTFPFPFFLPDLTRWLIQNKTLETPSYAFKLMFRVCLCNSLSFKSIQSVRGLYCMHLIAQHSSAVWFACMMRPSLCVSLICSIWEGCPHSAIIIKPLDGHNFIHIPLDSSGF